MDVSTFFLHLFLVLVSARVLAEVAVRLQTPSVIGELIAGVLLGPSVFGWIEPGEAIKLLAEIGIILLLFEVGLGTDLRRLVKTGVQSTVVAMLGVILPFGLGFFVSYNLIDLPILVSLFIGGTITATSIGITIRVLSDFKRQQSVEGQIVLGAAVIDDVIGVILLAVLYEFATAGSVDMFKVSKVVVFVGAFFMLAPLAAKTVSMLIRRFNDVTQIPGMIPTTIVSLVLFFAWLAHELGSPELLGGFAAGLALSRRFFFPFGTALHADPKFTGEIERQMMPVIHLFTPIFFVMVGLSLNLREIDWTSSTIWMLSFSLLVAAVVGKLCAGFFIPAPWSTRFIVGTAMIPRGEVGLIFAEVGRGSGAITNEIYAALVFVIAVTTLVPPLVLKWLYRRYEKVLP